jgi:hypothetical protein
MFRSYRTADHVMAGHSASEDARDRAYVRAIHIFDVASENKTWMPATSAGMTHGKRSDPSAARFSRRT